MKYIAFFIVLSPGFLFAETTPQQLFNEYCIKCHGPAKPKGDIRLDQFGKEALSDRDLLETIVGVLVEMQMPPRKQKQPPIELRDAVVKFLKNELYAGSEPSVLKRLTRREYTNTINDLFGTEFDLTELLPGDSNEEGFDKLGESQLMSPHQLQAYLKTARFVADRLVLDKKPEERVWIFGPKQMHGSDRGDYRTEEARVLSTNYPWRSNLHFSTSKNSDDLFVIPQYGRYRFDVNVTIANSKLDQTIGINSGDPRYPTTFKKITRVLLPSNATSMSIELTLTKGTQVSFTFDSASTWSVNRKPKAYKGAKLFFSQVKVTGPIYDAWPTSAEQLIFSNKTDDLLTGKVVRLFTNRSLPVADLAEFERIAQQRLDAGGSEKDAARSLISAVLSSPYFLYKHESPTLDDLSLAYRLSYFLWNSAPDPQLLATAKSGQLSSRTTLTKQVVRMLDSAKIDRFCDDFTRQWLQTDKIDDVAPDDRVNQNVTILRMDAIAREAEAFFSEILRNDLGMVNFIDSDFVMVNDLSAKFYGYKGVKGRSFRPYKIAPDDERGGIIGQAGFLKLTSNKFDTSPIRRGAWILKNIYGEKLAPPADLKFEEPDIRGAKTVKEVMAKHQNTKTCYRCHSRIDPLGLALEHYDPVGRWRKEYTNIEVLSHANGKGTVKKSSMPIDSKATLLDGRSVNSMSSLKQVMLDDKEEILKGILSKLVSYSMGRETRVQDEPFIDEVYDSIEEDDFSLRAAIIAITTHDKFRQK